LPTGRRRLADDGVKTSADTNAANRAAKSATDGMNVTTAITSKVTAPSTARPKKGMAMTASGDKATIPTALLRKLSRRTDNLPAVDHEVRGEPAAADVQGLTQTSRP
jgi:hypothetical protein